MPSLETIQPHIPFDITDGEADHRAIADWSADGPEKSQRYVLGVVYPDMAVSLRAGQLTQDTVRDGLSNLMYDYMVDADESTVSRQRFRSSLLDAVILKWAVNGEPVQETTDRIGLAKSTVYNSRAKMFAIFRKMHPKFTELVSLEEPVEVPVVSVMKSALVSRGRINSPCRENPEAFFVKPVAEQKVAAAICREHCLRVEECLRDALENKLEWGVYGGKTERERRAILRRPKSPAA